MTHQRKKNLQKNFARMFWVRVFLNIRFLNIVISLFYISRGLTLQNIIMLPIIWAITTMIFEIPSSYLADTWGRKKTILLAVGFAAMQMSVFMIAQGFWEMAIGMFFYGLLSASISGTDVALIYDTKKELGQDESLSVIGKYWSGMNFGKIISTFVGAYIAKDLTEIQFQLLLVIDIIFIFLAGIVASRLIEPNHKMDVEAQEAGIIRDAVKIFRKYPILMKAMINAEFV
jgi:MFS family permease